MIVEGIRWKRVEGGSPDTLGDGELMRANVAGKTLCIVRNGGKLHALLDRCPHQGSSFIGGWCEGGDIICPLHRMGFNLATGRNRGGGTDSAEVFPVE
ncbi:MAG: Rieske 2Fe-2S domain-containing protein, partial [Flavobacteriales bacterium]